MASYATGISTNSTPCAAHRTASASVIGREAFAQADLEFHLAVARAAHNPFFVSISTLIEVVLVAMLTISSPADVPDRLSASVVQHRRISKAIAERNPDEARRAMREVIQNGLDNAREETTRLG